MSTVLWDIRGSGYSDLATAIVVASATSGLYCHELAFINDSEGARESAKYAMSRGIRCFFDSEPRGISAFGFGVGIASRECRKLKQNNSGLKVLVLSGTDAAAELAGAIDENTGSDVTADCGIAHVPGFSHKVLPGYDIVIRAEDCGKVSGLAVIEAMAVGAVAMVPESGSDTEYVRHGRNGYVYSGGDVVGFVQGLAEDKRTGGRLISKLSANAMLTASWRDWRVMRDGWIAQIEALHDTHRS